MRTAGLAVAAVVLVMVGLGATAAPARAGGDADVTKAFTQFVHGVAAGKALPPELEFFVTPLDDGQPLPDNLTALRALLVEKPKVKVRQVVTSPGGKSAWLAAEIPARRREAGKPKADVLRASAFLAFDGRAWTVRAAHWSFAVRNVKPEMCGSIDYPWQPEPSVPAALVPMAAKVVGVLDEDHPPSFSALLSADKRALVFGSAPKETFVGGAKIKSVFKRWSVSLPWWNTDEVSLPVVAGVGPDGELSWMALGVAYYPLCVTYRTLFVLASEHGSWRIVHQHYSEPVYPN